MRSFAALRMTGESADSSSLARVLDMRAAVPLADPPGMPNSYWAATAEAGPAVPEFDGSETAETVVIGAGYTGLSATLHLAERGRSVLVLDAHEPGWGASGRNNGQVVAALKHEPHEVEERFGKERGAALIGRSAAGRTWCWG